MKKSKVPSNSVLLPNLGEDKSNELMTVDENLTSNANNNNFTVQRLIKKTPSPSPQSQTQISTYNKYDVLTPSNLDEMEITSDTLNLHKVNVEIHQTPKKMNKGYPSKRTTKGVTKKKTNIKPTIFRQNLKLPKLKNGKTLIEGSSKKSIN